MKVDIDWFTGFYFRHTASDEHWMINVFKNWSYIILCLRLRKTDTRIFILHIKYVVKMYLNVNFLLRGSIQNVLQKFKIGPKFRMRYSLYDSGYKKVWVSTKHELQSTGGLTKKAKFYRLTIYIHHYYDYCFETLWYHWTESLSSLPCYQ